MDDITNQLIIIKPDDLEEVKSELREIKTYLQDLFSTNPILCKDEYIDHQGWRRGQAVQYTDR